MRDEKKSGALLSYFYLGLKVVIGIAYTPIMLRYLGQAEFGVYTEAQTVISFLTMPEVLLDLPGCFSVRLRAPNCTSPDIATYYMAVSWPMAKIRK